MARGDDPDAEGVPDDVGVEDGAALSEAVGAAVGSLDADDDADAVGSALRVALRVALGLAVAAPVGRDEGLLPPSATWPTVVPVPPERAWPVTSSIPVRATAAMANMSRAATSTGFQPIRARPPSGTVVAGARLADSSGRARSVAVWVSAAPVSGAVVGTSMPRADAPPDVGRTLDSTVLTCCPVRRREAV